MNTLMQLTTFIRRKKAISMMHCVIDQKLTYLSEKKITNLIDLVLKTENNNIPGIIIEAGCALGGSGIVIASAKDNKRPMQIYDVFDMIPPPTEHDDSDVHERYQIIENGGSTGIGGDKYYGYLPDLYNRVIENFQFNKLNIKKNSISLIKGLVQDTLRIESPVSLAHIDVDWYDPVMTCLARIEPNLSAGGSIVLDDYQDWSGCRKAADAYFSDKKDRFDFDLSSGALVITRRI